MFPPGFAARQLLPPGFADPDFHTVESDSLLRFYVAILEHLFGANWFIEDQYRKQSHPAFQQWKLCRELAARQGGIQLPSDRPMLPHLVTLLLDTIILSLVSHSDLQTFSLGTLANYGDANVQRRIHGVKFEPQSFLDLMTEFSYAAWHLSQGHSVMAFERGGLADLRADSPDFPLPFIADCKRILADTSSKRFHKIIGKANKQIKAHGTPCYGIVLIDVTSKITEPPRPPAMELPPDIGQPWPIPTAIEDIRHEVARQLVSDYYSSVSGAILVWDEHLIYGSSVLYMPSSNVIWRPGVNPNLRIAVVTLLRRSLVVRHKQPIVPLPDNDAKFAITQTAAFRIFGGI